MVLSLDRGLHWSILILSAPLPKRLRVALRLKLLKKLQLRLLKRADLLMIRHPKTGGTWLRTMLTHLYSQHYGISTRRVFKSDELALQHKGLPRWLISNGYFSWEQVIAERFRSNSEDLAGKKTLFVARHPGDIVVSWYIQYTKRTKAFKRELLEWEAATPIDRENIRRSEFLRHPDLGLPALIRYHNFWAEQLASRPDALIVRYEDLRLEPMQSLKKIADFIGEDFSVEEIEQTIAFTDFDHMRKLEEGNYFLNNSLKLRDASDPEMRKVRRAQVGGYCQDLDAEDLAWVDQQIAALLDPRFGYGPKGAIDAGSAVPLPDRG
ncbi:MAG: sulfotransferase domain-containing protein [Wenzhouxiangella sp.]